MRNSQCFPKSRNPALLHGFMVSPALGRCFSLSPECNMPSTEHIPIMLDEVIRHARPRAGDVVVDCTLGGGGHALALLERIAPGGRLIGLDADPIELPRTAARIRDAGFGPGVFEARRANFNQLPQVLRAERLDADIVIADLGISAMQADAGDRGFNYKGVGPLDMRM